MLDSINPLNWLKSAQDWFAKTERSSGFRPYLIFLIIHIGFVIILLTLFKESELTKSFAMYSLYISIGGFVLIFIIKALQDPDFCRSEKHIETVRRIEVMEQKGDRKPQSIDITTTKIIQKPKEQLVSSAEREQE